MAAAKMTLTAKWDNWEELEGEWEEERISNHFLMRYIWGENTVFKKWKIK